MKGTRKQIEELLKCISEGVYEKEHILSLSLLCCVAGESIFLLGPPGTAKSMVARRLKEVFSDARSFEYLMSRFSTPDELFGPVSVSKLKDEDVYERCVEGFLPEATVVFLDEIWKAGPAIQNALLTVINERIYQNGRHTIQLPMKMLIAASNELPAEDEGLEALWDRFLVRVVSNCICNEKTFYRMLCQRGEVKVCVPSKLKITEQQYRTWQTEAEEVMIGDDVLKAITEVRKRMTKAAAEEEAHAFDYYISDRRWRKIARMLQMSALLNDRNKVEYADLLLLRHMLWNNTEVIGRVWQVVNEALFADVETVLSSANKTLEGYVKKIAVRDVVSNEKNFKVYNYFYFNLVGFPNARCYLYAPDYKHLSKTKDTDAIVYWEKIMGAYCIRRFDSAAPFSFPAETKVDKVKVSCSAKSVTVDNRLYVIECDDVIDEHNAAALELAEQCVEIIGELRQKTQHLQQMVEERMAGMISNLFVSKDDCKQIRKYTDELCKRIEELEIKIISTAQLVGQ